MMLIIDGTYVLGTICSTTERGIIPSPEDVFKSTVNSIKRAIAEHRPKFVVVAFDDISSSWRLDCKATYARASSTPNFIEVRLIELIRELQRNNIYCASHPGSESKDIIASIASKITPSVNIEVRVIGPSRRLWGLLNEHTSLYRHFKTRGEKHITAEWLQSEHQVTPKQWEAVMVLTGDTKRSLKGIPKIGEKTAKKLISEYAGIRDFCSFISLLDGQRGVSVRDNINAAMCDQELLLYKQDLVLGFTLAELRRELESHAIQPQHQTSRSDNRRGTYPHRADMCVG